MPTRGIFRANVTFNIAIRLLTSPPAELMVPNIYIFCHLTLVSIFLGLEEEGF